MDDLSSICEQQFFRLNPKIRSEKTRKHYRFALNNLASAVGRAPSLHDLSDDNVMLVMTDLIRRGRSVRTANERRDRLCALWAWLCKRGLLTRWPTIPRMVEPTRIPRGWSREQLPTLFAAFESERVLICGIPAPKWWRALHLVAWDAAERIGAIIAVEWKHLESPWLIIPAELRKGGRADKAYKLEGETIAALEEIRLPLRSLIFPWPYNYSYLWIRYKIIRERAGLPIDRYSSFHRMRKSSASHFTAAGGDAMELLGHESRRTTKKYLDPTIVNPPQASDLLFRPDRPQDPQPPKAA